MFIKKAKFTSLIICNKLLVDRVPHVKCSTLSSWPSCHWSARTLVDRCIESAWTSEILSVIFESHVRSSTLSIMSHCMTLKIYWGWLWIGTVTLIITRREAISTLILRIAIGISWVWAIIIRIALILLLSHRLFDALNLFILWFHLFLMRFFKFIEISLALFFCFLNISLLLII